MALPAASYANLSIVRPHKRSVSSIKQDASAERKAETRIKAKVEQAHRILSKLEERSKRLAAAIKVLQASKRLVDERAEHIEDQTLDQMTLAGLDKVAGVRVTLIARPSGNPCLIVDDEKAIPNEYIRESFSTSVDKIAIKAALDKGVIVPGVSLMQKVSLIRK